MSEAVNRYNRGVGSSIDNIDSSLEMRTLCIILRIFYTFFRSMYVVLKIFSVLYVVQKMEKTTA